MENCTIYSHRLEFEKIVEIVKKHLPKAKLDLVDESMQKSLVATIKGGLFSKSKVLKINYRQRKNPSYKLVEVECPLSQNLAGMVQFVQSLPAENEDVRTQLLYKIMSVNCEMPFMADPAITPEFEGILKEVLIALDAIVFAAPAKLFNRSQNQYFADKNMALILDTSGRMEVSDLPVNVDAKYHDEPAEEATKEQLDRKARSEKILEERGIPFNKRLPCVPGEDTVQIRSLQAVTERAYALLVTAVMGEGVDRPSLDKVIADKKITSFSPKERAILATEELNDSQRAYATWRYESLYLILWAIGQADDLKYPSEICDVPALVKSIFQPTREVFEASSKLRTTTEILDVLDLVYRMNWACVNASVKGEETPGDIQASIVYERHYALNWLTNFQGQDWDDVQTNT